METVVDLPNTPYFCTLNFQPGEHIKISSTVLKEAERLNVVFKCDEGPNSDIGLFIAIDFKIDEVVVTSKLLNGWGKIKKYYGLCFAKRPNFKIEIECTHDVYKVSINGTKIDEYVHEIPWYNITHMAVCGDINIKTITYLPVKQTIPTGETPPPDYEMAIRSDYGSVNIPILFKKEDEILTMYPTLIPLVPVRPETREPSDVETSSTYSISRITDNNNDIEIPYYGRVPSNFCNGSNIALNAVVPATGTRFLLSLQYIGDIQTDVPLEITVDLSTNTVSLNSSLNGSWNEAKLFSNIPVTTEEPFTLSITCISNGYQILINNREFDYFLQENTYNYVNHFAVCGDIKVQQISYTTEASQNVSINIDQNYDTPPPSYNEAVANFSHDPSIQPILGHPPPLPPTFVPQQMQDPSQLIPSPIIQEIFSSTSSNFRPVKPAGEKKVLAYPIIILFIVLIIFASSIAKKKKTPIETLHESSY